MAKRRSPQNLGHMKHPQWHAPKSINWERHGWPNSSTHGQLSHKPHKENVSNDGKVPHNLGFPSMYMYIY